LFLMLFSMCSFLIFFVYDVLTLFLFLYKYSMSLLFLFFMFPYFFIHLLFGAFA